MNEFKKYTEKIHFGFDWRIRKTKNIKYLIMIRII